MALTEQDKADLAEMVEHPGWLVAVDLLARSVSHEKGNFLQCNPLSDGFMEKAVRYNSFDALRRYFLRDVYRAIDENPPKDILEETWTP